MTINQDNIKLYPILKDSGWKATGAKSFGLIHFYYESPIFVDGIAAPNVYWGLCLIVRPMSFCYSWRFRQGGSMRGGPIDDLPEDAHTDELYSIAQKAASIEYLKWLESVS